MTDDASFLTNSERLTALLYQYNNLYDRWSEDRQIFAKKGADLSAAIDAVEAQMANVGNVGEHIRQSVERELKPIIHRASQAIVETATGHVKAELSRASQCLDDAVSRARRALDEGTREITKTRWQWLGGMLLTAVISSVIATSVLLPKRIYRLTDWEVDKIHHGHDFLTLLSHSSEAARKKLFKQLDVAKQARLKAQKVT